MPVFRPDQPYAQVFGEPGVWWQQNGHYFTRDGRPVGGKSEESPGSSEPAPAAAPEPAPKPDMRRKENRHLRDAMARIYGEPDA